MVANLNSLRTSEAGDPHAAAPHHRRRDMTMGLILIVVIGYLFLMAFVTFHRLVTLLLPENPAPSPISPPVPFL